MTPPRSVRVPGDKSITHRALLVAGLARGRCAIRGALDAHDTAATAAALRALGVGVSPLGQLLTTVSGGGTLRAAPGPIDCGNSGTTARLLAGLVAAAPFTTRLTGDASLRRRPMRRVVAPLQAMGARVDGAGDTLPLAIHGGALHGIAWTLDVASAQVKSAVLLAALAAGVEVTVTEPGSSRDHTERLLRRLGCRVTGDGHTTHLVPAAVPAFELRVPGDASSAAFLAAAVTLAGAGALRIAGVGVNPTRTGWIDVLRRMGGRVAVEAVRDVDGEPEADLIVRPAPLRATRADAGEAPRLIDEVPVLAVLAARAEGTTTFSGVGELRVKESDRLALLAANLRALGVAAEADPDALHVTGTDAPPRGRVITHGDHRLAMAFAVLGTVAGAAVRVDDPGCAAVSYPGFGAALHDVTLGRAS